MQIIKPNNITIGELNTNYNKYVTAEQVISNALNIGNDQIQFAKIERDGNLLPATDMNPFMQAVHLAYSFHLPLIITPDIIWYLISSGVAIHINKNAEQLRDKFVSHQGKEVIRIRRDDFRLNAKNPWHEVIDEFSIKIGEKTKNDIAEIIVANFTTTTKDSRVVSQIVLMDAMQSYFDYRVMTMCGIPEIRLKGEKHDWENLKSKSKKLIGLIPELNLWMKSLDEILNNFINVFDNKIDNTFWNRIYKEGGGSGGPYITGWSIALFPYIGDQNYENRYVWNQRWDDVSENSYFEGLNSLSFPTRMSKAPFTWEYFGQEIKMSFLGGLFGIIHDKDQSLLPVFGYAVTEEKINNKTKHDEF